MSTALPTIPGLAAIAALPEIYVNGGKRGCLVGLAPDDLRRLFVPRLVRLGI